MSRRQPLHVTSQSTTLANQIELSCPTNDGNCRLRTHSGRCLVAYTSRWCPSSSLEVLWKAVAGRGAGDCYEVTNVTANLPLKAFHVHVCFPKDGLTKSQPVTCVTHYIWGQFLKKILYPLGILNMEKPIVAWWLENLNPCLYLKDFSSNWPLHGPWKMQYKRWHFEDWCDKLPILDINK